MGQGPQSLRLADVAKEAGVVNATVLHHFGSIEDVHSALMERMIADLVGKILSQDMPSDQPVQRGFAFPHLIEAFQDKGAARLAAWLELSDQSQRMTVVREAVNKVIHEKIRPLSLPQDRVEDIILISIILALGLGLFGTSLEGLLDRPEGTARDMATELLISATEDLTK